MAEDPERQLPDLTGSLCHYTKADTAFQFIVPSLTLRMSAYSRMSDPFENRELMFSGRSRTPKSEDDMRELHGPFVDVCESIQRVRNRMLLLSFTVDATEGYTAADRPFMHAWARARMWQQYASDHAGACIVFDRERTIGNITAELHQVGSPTSAEVAYSAQGFRGTSAADLNLDSFREDYSQKFGEFVRRNERDLFFTKTLDWQTEYEFRITVFPNEPARDGYLSVSFGGAKSIRAVIVGENFPTWQIPAAKAACDRHAITLLKMTWPGGRPWPAPVE